MSTVIRTPLRARTRMADASVTADAGLQAYRMLRVAYVLLPLVVGIDKYFDKLAAWDQYLADWVNNIVPGTAEQFMYGAGAIEIAAAVLVALKPRIGAYVVAAWLAGIVINLITYGEYLDVALRDAGLMMGALALARL